MRTLQDQIAIADDLESDGELEVSVSLKDFRDLLGIIRKQDGYIRAMANATQQAAEASTGVAKFCREVADQFRKEIH